MSGFGSIGEFAIGEKAGETEFAAGPPKISILRRAPRVGGGALIDILGLAVQIGTKPPDIGARRRPVHVQAIAS